MDYQVTIASAHEPVSLERAKRHLRIDHTDDDAQIRMTLRAARQWCEGFSRCAYLWQTIAAKMDSLPNEIRLPLPPLIAVSSIKYIDLAGSEQTVSASVYDVDVTSEPGEIRLAYNQSWPIVRGHHHDVTITFIAGHAATFTRSSSTLIVAGHFFEPGDFVRCYNIGGALPAGLSAGTNYYVKSVSGTAIELALEENGTMVILSDAGTGTHYIDAIPSHYVHAILLRLGDLWMHRGDEQIPLNSAVKELLWMGRQVTI